MVHKIENKRRFGSLPGVLVCKKLLEAVGNPQKELACIHIAGTNGKGSTAAFLHKILQEAGIRTGLFTSPHLIDFTERIQVNGERISKEDALRLGKMLLELEIDTEPAMFDYCFVMAMIYFKEQGCQLVVLETGLGGRLDATNVIDAPLLSIITKIGLDHMDILGNTLREIAQEKAGILKPNSRAVIESQTKEVLTVLQQTCENLEIPFCLVDTQQIVPTESGFLYGTQEEYTMKMLGSHQRENAMAAVLAARELQKLGYSVTEEAIHNGVAKARWNGRMEIVSKKPFLMIDGAHNGHGVEALVKSLRELYPNEKFHFVMGVLADKDYRKMAEQVIPLAEKVTTVTPDSSRALRGSELAEYISSYGVEAKNREDFEEILEELSDEERTVVFGSLYFIGEIRKLLHLPI